MLLVGVLKERTEKCCLTCQTTFQDNRLQKQSPVCVLRSSRSANSLLGAPLSLTPVAMQCWQFFRPCRTPEDRPQSSDSGELGFESPPSSFTSCVASGKLLNLSGSWILSVIVSASTGGYEAELGFETELQTVCHFRGAGGRPGVGRERPFSEEGKGPGDGGSAGGEGSVRKGRIGQGRAR